MKAISLHAPWATLIALGTKKWETRSWPCPPSIIGQRVAFHQAKTMKTLSHGGHIGDWRVTNWDDTGWHLRDLHTQQTRIDLPLGCIVASGVITRSLPIIAPFGECPDGAHIVPMKDGSLTLCAGPSKGLVKQTDISDQLPYGEFTPGRWAWELSDVAATTDRCPWCWGVGSLPDRGGAETRRICKVCIGTGECEPIPAKGKQGFWNWQGEIPPQP